MGTAFRALAKMNPHMRGQFNEVAQRLIRKYRQKAKHVGILE